MDSNLIGTLWKLALYLIPLWFALSVHEFAHAWVALRKGDRTASLMGRLTVNPLAHADLFGTLLVPALLILTQAGFMFGWAKPVPVNPRNLARPKPDMFWIALAGPLSNFILGFLGALALYFVLVFIPAGPTNRAFTELLLMFIPMNFLLGAFNLIPLHPLDGGKILDRFLPVRWSLFLEQHQTELQYVLMAGILLGLFRYLAAPMLVVSQGLISLVYNWL